MASNPKYSGLLTDLYELTMAAGYIETGFDARATFELFVRSLPPRRSYLVGAGREQEAHYRRNEPLPRDGIRDLERPPRFPRVYAPGLFYLEHSPYAGGG